jgi:hypothetical protein
MVHDAQRDAGRRVHRTDGGTITAFVVGLLGIFVASAGLAIDSGRVVASHLRAADVAENAARTASQEITGIRSGRWYLDPARARSSALAVLVAEGMTGVVAVAPRRVTVTATTTVTPTLLRLFGVGDRPVRATRSAEPRSP